jgi:hypothetical protein
MKKKNGIWRYAYIVMVAALIIAVGCKQDETASQEVFGMGFLGRIPGLWHGPVSSSTPAGSFDTWYVDFRPVSEAQVSQFSLLDTNTVNNISFFIVKYDDQLKVAMRTEGCFMNQCCVTYEVMDSVSEQSAYYRFCDFIKGRNRAYTEFTFNDTGLVMKVYTNKFNTVTPLQLHSTWTAKLGSKSNAAAATAHFRYPQAVMVKDFSNAFANMTESIFFTFENDPYQSVTQPYVGSTTVHVTIDSSLVTDTSDEVFVLLTTEPLFNGSVYIADNLRYISKYVLLTAQTHSYKIQSIHPGQYYIYSLIDKDHDHLYLSGDYMSSNFTNAFTVTDRCDVDVNTTIDYIIP